jgi:hypothetical protein
MKKIFLSAVTLLVVGSAFAQSGVASNNDSRVTATGTNTGTITQNVGVTEANYSEMTQTGTNEAIVLQTGGNDSFITQNGATNFADVRQDGGAGAMYQVSIINQTGIGNVADLDQNGTLNASTIIQVSPSMGMGSSNVALVQQGQLVPMGNSDNVSYVNQDNWGNFTDHTQNGIGNLASTTQSSYAIAVPVVPPYFQGSEVTQTGDRNMSFATQTGDNNRIVITQSAEMGGIVGGFTNEATVTQLGEMNSSVINQMDSAPGAMDANNSYTLSQTNTVGGPGNFDSVTQTGASTWSTVQINN